MRGKWQDPDALALFTARDVRERPDCRITLAKQPAGHWAGGTSGATCFSPAAEGRVAVAMTLSPQTLEWREGAKGANEMTVFGREREGAAASAAVAPAAATAVAKPAAGEAAGVGGLSSSGKEQTAVAASPALTITSPSSPSRKFSLAELRGVAGAERVPLGRFFEGDAADPAAVVVVTSRSGAISVFSFAEISSSSVSLDVSGSAPRLVAAPGRSLDDVASIELRVLGPAP